MTFFIPAARALFASTILLLSSQFANAGDTINLELNKLEPAGKGCRIYMVFTNTTSNAIDSFKPDLVFFDQDGVIATRLVVEGGPLSSGKTRVKLFDVAEFPCGSFQRVLLNDVRACTGHEALTCLNQTRTSSRTAVEFIK